MIFLTDDYINSSIFISLSCDLIYFKLLKQQVQNKCHLYENFIALAKTISGCWKPQCENTSVNIMYHVMWNDSSISPSKTKTIYQNIFLNEIDAWFKLKILRTIYQRDYFQHFKIKLPDKPSQQSSLFCFLKVENRTIWLDHLHSCSPNTHHQLMQQMPQFLLRCADPYPIYDNHLY